MRLKLNCLLTLSIAILLACNKSEGAVDLSFNPSSGTLEAGRDVQLVLQYRKGDGTWKNYDCQTNELGIVFASSKESVATVTQDGVVHTLKSGYTNITAVYKDATAKFSLMVSGTAYDLDFDFSKKLTGDMIYTNNAVLPENSAMQSFDILNNGDIMLSGCSKKEDFLYFKLVSPGKDSNNTMSVAMAGHGSNISVEDNTTKQYVWFTAYEDKIISRLKFTSGKAYSQSDCTDNYYTGDSGTPHVCTDVENDLISFVTGSKVRIYKLSEAKKAPEKDVQLSLASKTITVKAHDLRSIQSVADFTISQTVPIQGVDRDGDTRPWQGYTLYKDRLYWFSGDGTNPDCAISVITFDGTVEKSCKQLSLDDEQNDYIRLGISETGYLEPEGIKIRHGKLYLGFIWNLKDVKPWTWRATVVKFN